MLRADDRIRLQHMLDAANKAVRVAEKYGRASLEAEDEPLADALVRLLSVIGEAASKVSPETRSDLTGLPWHEMVGMRQRLIHSYFDINLEIVWATVQENLPALIRALEAALASDQPG